MGGLFLWGIIMSGMVKGRRVVDGAITPGGMKPLERAPDAPAQGQPPAATTRPWPARPPRPGSQRRPPRPNPPLSSAIPP